MRISRSRIGALRLAAVLLWSLHCSIASSGANQWTPIGPDGANVTVLAVDPANPSTVYAGTTSAGVFKSTDSGATWQGAGEGLPTTGISALVIDPVTRSTVYAGTGSGIFKSVDGGQHWSAQNRGLGGGAPVAVNGIAVDPAAPATVYAATSAGLFKAIDGAASWTPVCLCGYAHEPEGYTLATAVTIDPTSSSTLYAGFLDGENGSGLVYKSTDGGSSWGNILVSFGDFEFDGIAISAVYVDPRAPSRVYVAFAFGATQKSLDGGTTWSSTSRLPFGQAPAAFAVDPASSDTLYVTSDRDSIWRSTDAGSSWDRIDTGFEGSMVNVLAAAPSAPTTLYAGARNGLFRSVDGGVTWKQPSLGVRMVSAQQLAVDPAAASTLYATMAGILTKTNDGGADWMAATLPGSAGKSVQLVVADPLTSSTLYAVDSILDINQLYKSVDAGATWTLLAVPVPNPFDAGVQAFAIAGSQPATLFVGGATGIYRSSDGGATWFAKDDGLMRTPFVSALAVDPTSADNVYAATAVGGRIFKSTDRGDHWRSVPLLLRGDSTFTQFAIDPLAPTTLYAAYYFPANGGGVLKSSDGGETWAPANYLLPPTPVWALAIDPADSRQIYAATALGVFRSTDGAASWAPFNTGLPTMYASDVAIDRTGTLLRAATPAGLYEYSLAQARGLGTVAVIEYYDAGFDHYFVTSFADEIVKLDDGVIPGWTRTGQAFNAYPVSAAGTSPVCRFYTTAFGPKSSHFYSPFAAECSQLQSDARWILETSDAFDIAVPTADGSCAAGLAPVYRLYNNGQGGAPSHRYTMDRAVRAQMIAQGWVPEGLGPDGVQMCAPL